MNRPAPLVFFSLSYGLFRAIFRWSPFVWHVEENHLSRVGEILSEVRQAVGLEWNEEGLKSEGFNRNGMGWNGMEWNGVGGN